LKSERLEFKVFSINSDGTHRTHHSLKAKMPDKITPEADNLTPELVVDPSQSTQEGALLAADQTDTIEQPAKIMRMGAMLRQLLAEIRADSLDELSRNRLKEIYEASLTELGEAVSGDLREELGRLTLPLDDDQAPTQDELRVVKAQLVGWLEGLIQGIQATLFARQVAAQSQLANTHAPLPPGRSQPQPRSGTYL